MNILLVDDNDLDAEFLRRSLRKIGAAGTLVRARDGVEALDILKDGPTKHGLFHPFVVLLDINMPRMDGHEFLEALRKTKEIKNTRVVVFTTSNNKRDVELAYQNNASGYIVKPTRSTELQKVLHTLWSFWSYCESPEIVLKSG